MSPKYLCISICMYVSSIYLHIFLHPKMKFMIQRFLWKFRSGSKGLLFPRCNSEMKINGSHYLRKNTYFLVFSFGCLHGLQSALFIWPLWPSQCRGGQTVALSCLVSSNIEKVAESGSEPWQPDPRASRITQSILWPHYSKCDPQARYPSITWSLWERQSLGPTLDLPNQNLHFNKFPWWSI